MKKGMIKIKLLKSLKDIAKKIKLKNNFLILGHIDPDGDCVGSIFALKWILDKLNKDSLMLFYDSPRDKFDFLINSTTETKSVKKDKDYIIFNEINIDDFSRTDYHYIVLDSSNPDRLGEGKKLIKDNFVINIDHHPDNTNFGDVNFIDSDRAAVGEIVYELSQIFNIKVDKKIGEAIATAIITDTGSLQYENTSARVLEIMSKLMKKNIDLYKINRKLYGNYSFNSVKLKGLALSNLKRTSSGKIAWLFVDEKMMNKTCTESKDVTGFVNYARDIAGVEIGIAFVEKEKNEIDVSLRSNSYVEVNEIASIFGGGGHARAAGCSINMKLDRAMDSVLQEVKKFV